MPIQSFAFYLEYTPCMSASTSAYEKILSKLHELDGADEQLDLDSYTALCIARNDH